MGTVADTIGAASIGFYVSCVVFGVLTMQVFNYFHRFPMDRPAYKILVSVLWSMELLDQIFIAYSIYFYTVHSLEDPRVLREGEVVWTIVVQVMMNALVGTIVKCCFAMRVWRFSKNNIYITGLIAFIILAQLGLAILYCIRCFQLGTIHQAHKLRLVASLSLGAGLITDFVIATSLLVFLRRLRTGYKKSDTLINTLTVYAVNTGALTGAVALVTLLLYNLRPNTFNFMASYFNLGKLYAISFLCTLNTRKVLRGRGTDAGSSGKNTSGARNTFFMVTGRNARDANTASKMSLEIGVHQEISVVDDMERSHPDISLTSQKVLDPQRTSSKHEV